MQAGQDPIEERQRIKDAAKAAEATSKAQKKRQHLTLATAARDYHERVVEPRLTTKHAAQWIVSLELHVPAEVWHKPIAAITAPELLEALSSVRSVEVRGRRVPETLRRICQRLDTIFEDAIFHGQCTTNPAAAIPPQDARAAARQAGQRSQGARLPSGAGIHGQTAPS